MPHQRRRNTCALPVSSYSSSFFSSKPIDPLNHNQQQQQPQLQQISPSTAFAGTSNSCSTVGSVVTTTSPTNTTPCRYNTTSTTKSTSFSYRRFMVNQQQQTPPTQTFKLNQIFKSHRIKNDTTCTTVTTNALHQLGILQPLSWKSTSRSISNHIFLLGLFSFSALIVLNVFSTILLFYMTHIQTVRHDHNYSYNDTIMWKIPFWILSSSSSDDHWGIVQQHRRINTLLRTPTGASMEHEMSANDHIFPSIVQLQKMSTRNSNPYLHRRYHVQPPKQQHHWNSEAQTHPDYGTIRRIITQPHLRPINRTLAIQIQTNDYELYDEYCTKIIDEMDVPEMNYYYHQYDDLDFSALNPHDSNGRPTEKVPYNDEENPASCERPTWGYDNSKMNCNVIHELHPSLVDGLIHNSIQSLGHGYYRDTYLLTLQTAGTTTTTTIEEQIVMKQLRYEHPHTRQYQYEMNMEAMIMEITTASTVTSYIYGYCSTTTLVESLQDVTNTIVPYHKQYQPIRGRVSDAILHSLEVEQAKKKSNTNKNNINNSSSLSEPCSFNQLTVIEKLQYARQMSQALVEMHGYVGGVIVHDDVHPDQWLISHDKQRIVLNDMNNAVILLWSRQYNKYCTFWDHYGGDYRAPEMYLEGGTYTTTEQADVFPMGNLIYSLITGLYPYHNITNNDEIIIQQLTMDPNVRPYIHPKLRQMEHINAIHIQSDVQLEMYIYQRLIHIMDQCHHMAPHDRPSIFQVYQYLSQTQNMVDAYNDKSKIKILPKHATFESQSAKYNKLVQ